MDIRRKQIELPFEEKVIPKVHQVENTTVDVTFKAPHLDQLIARVVDWPSADFCNFCVHYGPAAVNKRVTMEADLFQTVYDALQHSGSRKISMAVENLSPITKIIWSSFDYMTGPELKFVWEVDYGRRSQSLTPIDFGSETGADRNSSAESSLSKVASTTSRNEDFEGSSNGVHFEEIDNIFHTELLTTSFAEADVCPMCMQVHQSSYDDECCSGYGKDDCENIPLQVLSDTAECSEVTMSVSGSTPTVTGSQMSSKDDCENIPLQVLSDTTECSEVTMSVSGSTPTVTGSQMSSVRPHTGASNVSTCSTATTMTAYSNVGSDSVESDGDIVAKISMVMEGTSTSKPEIPKSATDDQMNTSCVDSGITGTISTHSDLSMISHGYGGVDTPCCSKEQVGSERCEAPDHGYCDGMSGSINEMNRSTITSMMTCSSLEERMSRSLLVDDTDLLSEIAGENGIQPPSDDEFVAKFVLVEQICSTQLPSNPLIHKVTIVPKRKLLAGSFLFSATKENGSQATMFAISVVVADSRSDWYMERQTLIENMMSDIIPKIKALYHVEGTEELLCLLTKEFTKVFELFGAFDRWPLCPGSIFRLKIQYSHLWADKIEDTAFVAKAITALLQCKGNCVVLGEDYKAVVQMLITLAFFLRDEDRNFCVRPFRFSYSPYIKLQAIPRKHLADILVNAPDSSWPMCIVDVSRKVVAWSGPFQRHCQYHKQAEIHNVAQILRDSGKEIPAELEKKAEKDVKVDLRLTKADASVVQFLARMEAMPLEKVARLSLINQFLLSLENRARAFIEHVKHASTPGDMDKTNPYSGKWSVSAVRRAHDLTSDSSFAVILAEADRLKGDFAEFVCTTAS
uniref:UDENN domain-containing protein n=1 Tax=Steinernema glaseri TaxID=37863 RepID=A0A1I7YQV7_9BILA